MRLTVFLLLLLVIGCTNSSFVIINDEKINVEIADSDEERANGLMFRDKLDSGMLFVFEKPGIYPFWMKDTLIPLDIIWIRDNKVVFIQENAQPCNGSCTSYNIGVESSHVLELNAGEVKRLEIEIGGGII